MKRTKPLFSAIFVVALVLGNWASARAQGEVTLLAPSPARKTFDKLIANFQAKSGYTVKVTYSNYLDTRQGVAKGKAMDLNLIPAPYPAAIASGNIIPSSGVTIATLLTALAVPKGAPHPDISSPGALKKTLLAAKTIGYEDPDFTASGQGPWEAISKLGIADQVAAKSKIMLGPGGQGLPPTAGEGTKSTYTHLEKAEIDVGMLLLSDILESKDKYDIVGVLPKAVCTPTPLTGFISTKATNAEGAKALLQYLVSSDAQAVLKGDGFGPRS